MSHDFIIGFAKESLRLTLLLSSPMLGFGLVIGIMVSIFQAVTSIQEMTLTFIPKIVAVMVSIVIFLPWMLQLMSDFTIGLFSNIPNLIK